MELGNFRITQNKILSNTGQPFISLKKKVTLKFIYIKKKFYFEEEVISTEIMKK